ncbi:MAG: GGDEF domain-containing protein [Bacillota bacterium]
MDRRSDGGGLAQNNLVVGGAVMWSFFFHNMTTIISVIFIGARLKKFMIRRVGDNSIFRLLLPLLAGLLSTLVMYEAFEYQNMIFDLRAVPIYLISYALGGKMGFYSAIIPAGYRLYVGGAAVEYGILLALLLPAVVGHFFYNPQRVGSLVVQIDTKEAVSGYLLFSIIKDLIQSVVLGISLSVWLKLSITITFFSLISLLMMVVIIKDFNQSIMLEQELEWKANYDLLTDLPDLHYFKNLLERKMKHLDSVVIMMIDLDDFKTYNDLNGHPAGNQALQELAQIFKEETRDEDIVARYGGEEFILAISNLTSREEVFLIAERLRKSVAEYSFAGGAELPSGSLTISIGVSSLNPDRSLDSLIKEADQALYTSKAKGKNCLTFFADLNRVVN